MKTEKEKQINKAMKLFDKPYLDFERIRKGGFVSIGVEVTGLSETDNEIIRLSAVKWSVGGEIENFDTWVKPTKSIPKEVKKIVKFKNKWLKNAPDLATAIKDFDTFIGELRLVAHNIAFDLSFIKKAYQTELNKPFENSTCCTLQRAQELAKLDSTYQLESYKIADVIKFYLKDEYINKDITPNECYNIGIVFMSQQRKFELIQKRMH